MGRLVGLLWHRGENLLTGQKPPILISCVQCWPGSLLPTSSNEVTWGHCLCIDINPQIHEGEALLGCGPFVSSFWRPPPPPGQLLPAVRRPCGCLTVTSFVTFQVLVEQLLCTFGTKTSSHGPFGVVWLWRTEFSVVSCLRQMLSMSTALSPPEAPEIPACIPSHCLLAWFCSLAHT